MPQYVVTPWKYYHELLQVRDEIFRRGEFAPPVDKRRHAVDWIAAWKMRGNLPHAIECTGQLVDSLLHHEGTQNSNFSIKATYAVAFSRFVTGFCDIEQNTTYKRTMFDVAREIGMPASFVELRHEVTHQEFPSLRRLKENVEASLIWLWDHYWISTVDDEMRLEEEEEDLKPISESERKEHIRMILETFVSGRKFEIKSGSKDISKTSASGEACFEMVKTCLNNEEYLSSLCHMLLEEKMMIPANRSLKDSMEGAGLIWDNFLRRMTVHQDKFISILINTLVTRLTQATVIDVDSDPSREALYNWILHIFNGSGWDLEIVATKVEESRHSVVNECLMNLNYWTKMLAGMLIESGNEEFREQWRPFLDS